MSGLKEYFERKDILDTDEILKDELNKIWKSYRSTFTSSNFDFHTLINAIYTFEEEIYDFNQMLYQFSDLPKKQIINHYNKTYSYNKRGG